MAGGRGERFWPVSQPDFPKQFVAVFNNTPLIVQTRDRLKRNFKKAQRVFIIPQALKKLTHCFIGHEQTILEPVSRNTAPAICLVAQTLMRKHGDGIMHVMPADHIISPQKTFIADLRFGARIAKKGYLVTYGIVPDRPETGYGYVKLSKLLAVNRQQKAFISAGFTEKPSNAKAVAYVRSKKYLWNAGIFSFSIKTILNEMKQHTPAIYHGVEHYLKTKKTKYFERVPNLSVDYGIMEKSTKISVVRARFIWDDVGSWLALERFFKKDKKSNIILGNAKGLEINNAIVYNFNNKPLKVYGIKDLIVVVSPHGVLVCDKKRAADLKKLLKK
jgi:mannose-1-phosphate guanylyltransferase